MRAGTLMSGHEYEEQEADALEAADQGARELLEGRYAEVAADRPGLVQRTAEVMLARRRWTPHVHGWACRRCGPSVHSRRAASRHDWWHRWLEAMFARIGDDVDQLEGEFREVRAEVDARCSEAERAAAAALQRVAGLSDLLRPQLARLLEGDGRVVDGEPAARG